MKKNGFSLFLLFFLLSLIVISCTPGTPRRSTQTATGQASVPIYFKPSTALWGLAEDSMIQQESSSIAIQAIYLNGQETILFFTLSGVGFEEFTPGIPVQIIDEAGYLSKLSKVVPLGIIDKVAAGIMVFEPRRGGALKLTLQWPSADGGAPSEKLVAFFSGEASEDYADSTYFASHEDPIEQAGYRISFQWWLQHSEQKKEPVENSSPETPVAGAYPTSTPYIPQPLAELASGVSILQECSFVFEDTEKDQIQTINVQLLNDANAIVQSEGIVSIPVPIIINATSPAPLPSVYP